MNRDFSLDLIVDGTYKSDMHLSSGKRTLCALCFRIAMLDNVFSFKALFLTSHSHNFEVVSKLLEEITKDKQLIYLTYQRSRELNIDNE